MWCCWRRCRHCTHDGLDWSNTRYSKSGAHRARISQRDQQSKRLPAPRSWRTLCGARTDAPAGKEWASGVVSATLISEPVCEFSRRSVVVGIVPALLVTTVGVGRTETNCGPWSTVGSTDDCFSLFAALPFPPLVFAASRELSSARFRLSVFSVSSADRSASRSCCISCSSAALRGGRGSICVNCAGANGVDDGYGTAGNGLDCEKAAIDW